MNIEHWTLTNKLLTINGKTSLLKTRAKVTELLRPWPNCLFLSVLWKTLELWRRWHNSWCSSYLQGPSPRQIPTWTLSSDPLEGSFALLGSLGDSGSSSGFFRWDCFAARLCLAPFENLRLYFGQFFLFFPLVLSVCAGHLRSRFFSQTSRQLILTARHQSFQNFDFLSSLLHILQFEN